MREEIRQLVAQDRCNLALAAVLQHSDLLLHPADVCSIARVSKAWRTALQQSCSCITRVTIDQPCLATLSDFVGAWMPRYGALVHTLEINSPSTAHCGRICGDRGCQTAYPIAANWLINMGIQAAAAQNLVRLRSFCSNLVYTPSTIAALPTDTLTQLEFEMTKNGPAPAAFVGPLSALTGLRSLHLWCKLDDPLPADYMFMVSRLTQLTTLDLVGIDADISTSLLPVHLERLNLQVWYTARTHAQRMGVTINLLHLTNLKTLVLDAVPHLAVGSKLPLQLQQLHLDCRNSWAPVDNEAERSLLSTQLQQLTELQVTNLVLLGDGWQVFRAVMAALPNISLSLAYKRADELTHVMEAAGRWHSLSQLSILRLIDLDVADGELQGLLRSIRAVPALTELVFSNVCILRGNRLHICRYLTQLSSLQALVLDFDYDSRSWSPFAVGDARHLSSLTRLTCLDFGRGGWDDGVGDAAAVAIACELTNLYHLSIIRCGIHNVAVLPVISKLSGLEVLMVRGNAFLHDMRARDLMVLSRLQQLRALDIADDGYFSERTTHRFWAAVNGEQLVDHDGEHLQDSGSEGSDAW